MHKPLKLFVFFSFIGAVVFSSFCIGMLHTQSMDAMKKGNGLSITEAGMNCCGLASVNKTSFFHSLSITTLDLREGLNILSFILALVFTESLRRETAQKLSSHIRRLIRGAPNVAMFPPLQMAFATGILNPKTY